MRCQSLLMSMNRRRSFAVLTSSLEPSGPEFTRAVRPKRAKVEIDAGRRFGRCR